REEERMQKHTSSWYIRLIILVLIMFVGLLTHPSDSTAQLLNSCPPHTVCSASIGEGPYYIHDQQEGTSCGNPYALSQEIGGGRPGGAPGLLLPSLLLLKQDTQWVAASVTETHGSSIGGPACCSTLGSSTYTSTLPANGIVTMREDNGVADVGKPHYTVTWIGTLDFQP